METLTVSPAAAARITEALREESDPNLMLRVASIGGDVANPAYMLALDSEVRSDDIIVETSGIRLVLNRATAEAAKGSCIEYTEDESGSGFILSDPNRLDSGGGCGAGCSCNR